MLTQSDGMQVIAMRSRDDFKPRLLSSQKPRKRHNRNRPTRDRVDLVDLHRRIASEERQRGSAKPIWLRVVLLIIAIAAFFLLGYLIAALAVPIWAKIFIFVFVAVLALIMSCVMTALLT